VLELRKQRRMRPAGERAFAARTPERTGIYSFERHKAAKLSRADAARFRKNAQASAFFERQPPWYRRTALHWVVSAKREETRQRRLDRLISDSAVGRIIGPLRRPAPQRPSRRGGGRRR
jgi:uncharacterized protein YdeI (YjbR/CyaY-like superfamily)